MFNNKPIGAAAVSVIALTLTGCATTAPQNPGVDPYTVAGNGAVYANTSAGTLEKVLDDGVTLTTATSVNTAATLYVTPTSAVLDTDADYQGSVQGNLLVFDEPIHPDGYNDAYIDAWTMFGGPGEYHVAFGVQRGSWSDNSALVYGVAGIETNPAALAGKANATYSGQGFVAGQRTDNLGEFRLEGDVAMNAGFNAAQISGTIGNLWDRLNSASVDGNVAMETTGIVGNSFTGALSGDAAFVANGFMLGGDAAYKGKFFGPDGQELGGVLSGSVSVGGVPGVFAGTFSGSQN